MSNHQIFVEGVPQAFEASGRDPLLRSALRAGVGFPYECNAGSCGSCKFELLDGTLDAPEEITRGTSARDRQKNKYLACQVKPTGDCRIKVRTNESFVPLFAPRAMRATLLERIDHTGDLSEFRFKADGPAQFLGGQYALLSISGAFPADWRAYSMANLPNESGEWHFFIKRVPGGSFTEPLFDSFRVGDALQLDGPYGMAYARHDVDRPAMCIAGGSGFSPMLGIARSFAEQGTLRGHRLEFVYGCRGPLDQPDAGLVEVLRNQMGSLDYSVVVSDAEAAAAHGWSGSKGFLHEVLAERLGEDSASREYYLSGPPLMVDAVVRLLVLEKKVPVEQIHYDRFF
ncbi:MAG: 2Fe-2S iron-sulfur cluster-binding protein [Acidovorax sp.]|nr:2Fe-2S iron-sulfur cluster-binding protein [Acidovorax sp.]